MQGHIIRGTLRPRSSDGSVAGYRVTASYQVLLGRDEDDRLLAPASRSVRVGDDGRFEIDLDAGPGEPTEPIDLVVAAPTGRELLERTLTFDTLSRQLRLRIASVRPETIEPSDDPAKGSRLRLTGRVVDRAGGAVPAGLPVVVLARSEPEDDPSAVFAAITQKTGRFAADWVGTPFVAASARIAGGAPQPVQLDAAGRLPRELLLAIDLAAMDLGDATACDAAPPVAPDAADLAANPEAFSQDLDGACVDLSMPNRTLEEFNYYAAVRTTEPRISAFTIDPSIDVPPSLVADLLGVSLASEAMGLTERTAARLAQPDISLSAKVASNLVRSDAPPSIYEIATAGWQGELDEAKSAIDTGLRSEIDRHVLDAGHAIDWDDTPTVHLAIDIAHGHLLEFRESLRADGFSLGNVLYSLPLAPGQRRQVAVLDWDRRTTSRRTEQLEYEERLDALLSRDRAILELVDTELTEELEASSKTTTFGFSGGIGAGFIGPGWGIFTGNSGGYGRSSSQSSQEAAREFAAETLQSLQDRIAQRSSSLRSQRSTVVQAVGQGERVRAETEFVGNYNRCHSVTVEYFQVLRHLIVTHELAHVKECLFVPLPMDHFDDAKALRWKDVLRRRLRDRRLAGGFRAMERIADDWVGWEVPEGSYAEEALETVDGELRISFLIPRPRDAEDGAYQVDMWDVLAPFLETDPLELFTAKLNERTQEGRDLVFRRDVAPTVAASIVDGLRLAFVTAEGGEVDIPTDPSLVSRYAESEPLYVTLNAAGAIPAVPREEITHIKIWYDGAPLPPDSRVIVHSGKVRYRTDSLTALLFDRDRILDDLDVDDAVVVPTPLAPRELRDPRDEDRELAARLRDHLNENIEYYHQAIWMSLDPQRRFMLLDAVIVPGTGGRSVAGICANQVMGVVGNSLVLPVSPGLRLDPTFAGEDAEGNPVPLIDAYATAPPAAIRVSLPTRGVHAEAVMGACNACEEIDDTRYWRWSTEGMLAMPEIEAVSTDTRAAEEPDLTPTGLPAPLVTIQNAPAAPEPTGLAGAFGLLSTPGLFRDVTGLEGTQENAAAALQGAVAASSAIGEEAYKLATQNMLGQNAQRLMGQLVNAQGKGLLSDEAFTELGTDLISALIGATMPNAPIPWLDPKLAEAAGNATSGQILATTPNESVDITYDGANGASTGDGVYRPSQPLYLTALVAPIGEGFITYDQLTVALGDRFLDMVERGYVGQADDGSGRLLVRQQLRIIHPELPAAPNRVAGEGRVPVVILAHGSARGWTDDDPVPNLDGFAQLQDHLAERGIVSVSIDLNAASSVGPLTYKLDVGLMLTAVDRVRGLDTDATSALHARLDLGKIGFFAHSDGATAVLGAIDDNADRDAADRFDVTAVCVTAPVDRNLTTVTPLHTGALLVLEPGLDGEAPAGRSRTSARTALGTFDRATCEKSLLFLDGCNHRRFNSVWADDDTSGEDTLLDRTEHADPERLLSVEDHRDLLDELAGGFLTWRLAGDTTAAGLFDGTRLNAVQARTSVHHSLGRFHMVLDSFDPDGAESGVRTLENATIAGLFDIVIDGVTLADLTNHHVSPVLWIAPGQSSDPFYTLTLNPFEWREYDEVLLRVATDFDLSNQIAIDAGRLPELTLRVVDITDQANQFTAAEMRNDMLSHRPVAHSIANLDGTLENVATLQFPTMSLAIPKLLDGLGEVARLEIAAVAGFPQHLFLAELQLVRR
jgi:hypothetical protein